MAPVRRRRSLDARLPPPSEPARASLAVIGGSGFYAFLGDTVRVEASTPYGAPSSPITVGTVGDRRVAFLARHGIDHQFPPHRINFRANLWALRQLGVQRIFAPCAAGSLRPDRHPGDFVILDQLVDRTWGRPDTYLDGPTVDHVSFADPYCPDLGAVLAAAAPRAAPTGERGTPAVHRGGTIVVIQGPRFSTRAESRWFRAAGWDVVGMTQYPEAYLARELGMCYAGLALVTDYDTGVGDAAAGEGAATVTMAGVMEVLADNVSRLRDLLLAAIPSVDEQPGCRCRHDAAKPFKV